MDFKPLLKPTTTRPEHSMAKSKQKPNFGPLSSNVSRTNLIPFPRACVCSLSCRLSVINSQLAPGSHSAHASRSRSTPHLASGPSFRQRVFCSGASSTPSSWLSGQSATRARTVCSWRSSARSSRTSMVRLGGSPQEMASAPFCLGRGRISMLPLTSSSCCGACMRVEELL